MSRKEEDGISHVEFATQTRQHLNKYIKLADQKSSILLSAQIAYIGFTGNFIQSSWMSSSGCLRILSVLTLLSAIGAVAFAGRVVYPKTPKTKQGLFLWESIADRTGPAFRKEILAKTQDELRDELIDENHKLAKVSTRKYYNLRWSLRMTAITVMISIILGGLVILSPSM
jgi:hypothetical protein